MGKCNDPRKAKVGQTWYVVRAAELKVVRLDTPAALWFFNLFYVRGVFLSFIDMQALRPVFMTRSKRKAKARVGEIRAGIDQRPFWPPQIRGTAPKELVIKNRLSSPFSVTGVDVEHDEAGVIEIFGFNPAGLRRNHPIVIDEVFDEEM